MAKPDLAPRVTTKDNIFTHHEILVLIASVVLMFVTYTFKDSFFSQYNMSTLFRMMSFVTIVAFGQTLILLLGDIDLSVSGIACFSAVVSALFMTSGDVNPYVVFLIGLAIGCGCGLLNAFFITRFNIAPFIVTLATSQIFTGLAYTVSLGRTMTGIPESFAAMGQGMVFGWIPVPVIIMTLAGIVLVFFLKYTVYGRYIYAIGGNTTAARFVGINVRLTRTVVYVMCGFLSALAGILMMARLGTAQPTIGAGWMLPSIVAAVIGGTSMSGGRGGIWSTVCGGLLMTVISNAVGIMRVSNYVEEIIVGSVAIVAVLTDALRTSAAGKGRHKGQESS